MAILGKEGFASGLLISDSKRARTTGPGNMGGEVWKTD